MHHDRSRWWLIWIRRLFRSTVFKVEPFWELEIQLNSSALEGPLQGVFDRDVYLWTVERTVSRIYLPIPRVVFLESFRELLFTSITFPTKLMITQLRVAFWGV